MLLGSNGKTSTSRPIPSGYQKLKMELLSWWETRPHKSSFFVLTVVGDHRFENQYEGQPYTNRQHFMKKLCEKAGVKPFGFHAIRHLTASTLYRAGRPQAEIQAILRHSSPTTTNRYLHSLGMENVRTGLDEVMSSRGPGRVIEFKPRVAHE
ncbi:tyrosine-type recombinase/integrase [Fundidesulfovibrio terrae]|uniref:tyrosine-type recombinase/integrase n=1 Tax=Fundidesulfovibrio terrae TaxID=2922866 RepID=UPI00243522EC|nr:tyrosine-type recombinase/integrase [Fundidesulfovibrio terrae]